jgi:hypothetical protein
MQNILNSETFKTISNKKTIFSNSKSLGPMDIKQTTSDTLFEMIQQHGVIDLILISRHYEEDERPIEEKILTGKRVTSNCSHISDKIKERLDNLKKEHHLFIEENYKIMDRVKLYQKLFNQKNFIEYLIYEFIDKAGFFIELTNGHAPEFGEEFMHYNLKYYDTKNINRIQSNEKNNLEDNNFSNNFINNLNNRVAQVYETNDVSKIYEYKFFSAKSFIKLYTLIYNDLHKAIYSKEKLESDQLLDSVIAKCSNLLISMNKEGAIMLCAIGLELPIYFYYITPPPETDILELPPVTIKRPLKKRLRQNLYLKAIKVFPRDKNKIDFGYISQAQNIKNITNNEANNIGGYYGINPNNKIKKKFKVKKQATIKKQHKSIKHKSRKRKSKKI